MSDMYVGYFPGGTNTTIMESCAILQYLGERYPSDLLPAGNARWDVMQWLCWQAADFGPVFGNNLSYTRYMDDFDEAAKAHSLERFGKEGRRLASVLNRRVERSDYVCGKNSTIADITIYPWVRGWKWSKTNMTDQSTVMTWIDRGRARPAVGRGLAYGMPKDEIAQWSARRKADYAKRGTSIDANESLRTES